MCNLSIMNFYFLLLAYILQDTNCVARTVTADVLLLGALGIGSLYTKFLTDRGQRNAFLETRRYLQMHFRTKKENEKQERLLLSGLVFSDYSTIQSFVIYGNDISKGLIIIFGTKLGNYFRAWNVILWAYGMQTII